MLLSERIAASGVEVRLLTSKLLPGSPEPKGYDIEEIPAGWGWSALPSVLGAVKRFTPDRVLLLYIDWIYDCHPMITLVPALVKQFWPTIKFVTQFENISGLTSVSPPRGLRDRVSLFLAKLIFGETGFDEVYGCLLRDSESIIALSHLHLEKLEFVSPGISSKVTVIPAPPVINATVPPNKLSEKVRGRKLLGIEDEVFLFGYFGYIYWLKGIDSLIEAFGLLQGRVRLVMIGHSGDQQYMEKLYKLCQHYEVDDKIIWAGYCEDDVASAYISALDVAVLPFIEGLRLNNSSFAVVASHGIPIVSTRGVRLEPPFVDGVNVKLCHPSDPCALASSMQELIDNDLLRADLSAGVQKLFESCFAWPKVVSSTVGVLRGE